MSRRFFGNRTARFTTCWARQGT